MPSLNYAQRVINIILNDSNGLNVQKETLNLIDEDDILQEQKYILENLSSDEKSILRQYTENDSASLQFSIQNGVVMGLKTKMILFMPSKLARGTSMITSFNMQPWVKEFLKKRPKLLE